MAARRAKKAAASKGDATAVELEAPDPATIEFKGETFLLAPQPNAAPIMRFAVLAQEGADTDDIEGLAATANAIEAYLDPSEVARFWAHAAKVRASGDELLSVMRLSVMALTGRPTERPADSSGGPSQTKESSEADSSSRVIKLQISKGRPDLALAHANAARDRAQLQSVG